MRVAVIDLGTNTFNLLIAELIPDKRFNVVHAEKKAVKIGEGTVANNRLQPAPMERAMQTLAAYVEVISAHQCHRTVAFATSAIRSTENGADFVAEVRQRLHLDIRVIDGNEEAELIYDGVTLAVPIGNEPVVIMDIGGGSTEFIIADHTGILWKRSYHLGISRVLQLLTPSDPLSPNDLDRLDQLFGQELNELVVECKRHKVKTMIGSSGSFDSFMEMLWAQKGIDRKAASVSSEVFDLTELHHLHVKLIATDIAQRQLIPGLEPMRMDTIHLASYLVWWVIQECSLERLLLSSYALKEGVIHRILDKRI